MNKPFGMTDSMQDIGKALIGHSQQSAPVKPGLVDELFPYILIASKNMSARAISAWLETHKNLKLSATSVAKAIREQDRFFDRIYQRVLPGAEYLATLTGSSADDILANKDRALAAVHEEYTKKLNGTEEEQAKANNLIIGIKMLNEWECLPDEIRNLCIEKCITTKKDK